MGDSNIGARKKERYRNHIWLIIGINHQLPPFNLHLYECRMLNESDFFLNTPEYSMEDYAK